MSQPPSNPNVSQEVSPEQKVLQTIYENIEAQQKLLAELVNTPAWSALLDLRAQYTEASDSLNRLVKKSGVGVGPVTLRDSYSKYYDPRKFVAIAQERQMFQEMLNLGVISYSVDSDRAKDFLVSDPDAAVVFKDGAWKEQLKSKAVYGIPKQPDLTPSAPQRVSAPTPPPPVAQPAAPPPKSVKQVF